jgi:TonB family protein
MFEALLADQPVPTRRIAGPISLLLHAIAGSSMILAALWRVGEPGEPPVVLPPLVVAEPAQMVGSDLPRSPATGGARSPDHNSREVSIPIWEPNLPRTLPFRPAATPGMFDARPVIQFGASQASGPASGPGERSTASGSCTFDCGGGPITVGGDVVAPVPISQPSPDYPEPMRHVRTEGSVLLRAVIGLDGTVEDLRVEHADSQFFAEAARAAVARWRYRPATLNGRPVRVYLDVAVNFRLQ